MNSLGQQSNLKSIRPIKMKQNDLVAIETKVITDFHKFVNTDITIPIMTLFQQEANPDRILKQLNKMLNLSLFGKPQVFRLMEALVDAD